MAPPVLEHLQPRIPCPNGTELAADTHEADRVLQSCKDIERRHSSEMVCIMKDRIHSSICKKKKITGLHSRHVAEDFVWATSEQTRVRTFSLWIIRSIVERHGGSIGIDLATDTIQIRVPDKEKAACALEIEKQLSAMGH